MNPHKSIRVMIPTDSCPSIKTASLPSVGRSPWRRGCIFSEVMSGHDGGRGRNKQPHRGQPRIGMLISRPQDQRPFLPR